jgi:Peptidase family M28/Secretion system C-terminal sorting domain
MTLKRNRILIVFLLVVLRTTISSAQDARILQLLQQYNSDSVQLEVRKLSGELPLSINGQAVTIQSRLYNNAGNENTFKYCKERFTKWGYTVGQQSFSNLGKNIFAVKTGSQFPDRVCMIGAHYDDVPTGAIAPGADDNASGVAAVMEIARILATTDFPNTIVLALWDEEELGLIGSSAYTAGNVHGDEFLGYINLDMIGWDGNDDHKAELHVRPIGNSLQLADIVLKAKTDYNIDLELEVVNPGSINTDHYSFWTKGYTAVGINEEYVGDFNPYYHTSADVFSVLNLPFLDENAKLALVSFLKMAYTLPEDEAMKQVLVYPNPSNSIVNLAFKQVIQSPVRVRLTDLTGRILIDQTETNFETITLNTDQLKAGKYIVYLNMDETVKTVSIVKQ